MPGWRRDKHSNIPQGAGPLYGVASASSLAWYDPSPNSVTQLTSGGLPNNLAAQIKGTTNGAFAITINGTLYQIASMDFSNVKNQDDIAAVVVAALGAHGTCEYTAPNLIITTPAVLTPAITYASAPASGTDVSATLCLTAATGAVIG